MFLRFNVCRRPCPYSTPLVHTHSSPRIPARLPFARIYTVHSAHVHRSRAYLYVPLPQRTLSLTSTYTELGAFTHCPFRVRPPSTSMHINLCAHENRACQPYTPSFGVHTNHTWRALNSLITCMQTRAAQTNRTWRACKPPVSRTNTHLRCEHTGAQAHRPTRAPTPLPARTHTVSGVNEKPSIASVITQSSAHMTSD